MKYIIIILLFISSFIYGSNIDTDFKKFKKYQREQTNSVRAIVMFDNKNIEQTLIILNLLEDESDDSSMYDIDHIITNKLPLIQYFFLNKQIDQVHMSLEYFIDDYNKVSELIKINSPEEIQGSILEFIMTP